MAVESEAALPAGIADRDAGTGDRHPSASDGHAPAAITDAAARAIRHGRHNADGAPPGRDRRPHPYRVSQ